MHTLGLTATECNEQERECAPKDVRDKLLKQGLTFEWYYPSKKYFIQKYGDEAVEKSVENIQIQFTNQANSQLFELLEHQLESEEWRTGLQLLDAKEDNWFKVNPVPTEKFRNPCFRILNV